MRSAMGRSVPIFRDNGLGAHAAGLDVEGALGVLDVPGVHSERGRADRGLLGVFGELHVGREGQAGRVAEESERRRKPRKHDPGAFGSRAIIDTVHDTNAQYRLGT